MFFFKKKTLDEKYLALAEKGRVGKIVNAVFTADTYDERVAAINALGEIRVKESIEALLKSIKDDDEEVRLASANSLKKIGSYKEVEPLMHFAETEQNPEIAEAMKAAAVASKDRSPRW